MKKIKTIKLKNILFRNFYEKDFLRINNLKGLFVFPSGPGLATLNDNEIYKKSLQNADFVFFDSGYFVFLLRILKNINVKKFSGYLFLRLLFNHFKKNQISKILSVDPNHELSKKNKNFLIDLGIKKKNLINYISPMYINSKIVDQKLLKIANKIKPDYIILNLGGGVQEILGNYLKKNLNLKTRIICTGSAISFFTKDQVQINDFIDNNYIGWLVRLIRNPITFSIRLIFALKLVKIVLNGKAKYSYG